MKACMIACLLCAAGVSASRIQAGQVARLAAKARVGGDISQLVRTLNNGLVLDAQSSAVSVAELARQRLEMEAAELEQESLPDAMMLRAFVGNAPDSMLVMPREMLAEPAMPRSFVVVEPGMSASPLAVVPMEQEMSAPTLAVLPMEREPSVAASFDREPSVKDAVKCLTSEMRAVEENMGRKGLEDIINEFFSESAAKKAKKESGAAKSEKESAVTVAEEESTVKKAEEEIAAKKTEREPEAKIASKKSAVTRAEKESVAKKVMQESAAKKAKEESKLTTVEKESTATRAEKDSVVTKAKEESAAKKVKKESQGTKAEKESLVTTKKKEAVVKKLEKESVVMEAGKVQTARRAEKESVVRKGKEAVVKGMGLKPKSSLLKTRAVTPSAASGSRTSHKTRQVTPSTAIDQKTRASAWEKLAGLSHWAHQHAHEARHHAKHEAAAHDTAEVHQPAKYRTLAHEAPNIHQHAKHKAPAQESPKKVTPVEKASPSTKAATTIERAPKDTATFHGLAKAGESAEQAVQGPPTTETTELRSMLDKLTKRHASEWPKGSKDATWRDANTLYRRTCSNGRCVTKMMRRRK